ncbi:MAG: hypothetical protein ABL903_02015 [Methylococcales bacterium]
MHNYDGNPSGLNEALASLYRSKGHKCSASSNLMSDYRKSAKTALGITATKPSQAQCMDIYNWHCQKLEGVEDISQNIMAGILPLKILET